MSTAPRRSAISSRKARSASAAAISAITANNFLNISSIAIFHGKFSGERILEKFCGYNQHSCVIMIKVRTAGNSQTNPKVSSFVVFILYLLVESGLL